MVCVVDTHALVWYLTDSPRLGTEAGAILERPDTEIVIPTIVLAELKCLHSRKRIPVSLDSARGILHADSRCSVYPMTEEVVDSAPTELEIHDGIICATAIVVERTESQPVRIVTCDREITRLRSVTTVW